MAIPLKTGNAPRSLSFAEEYEMAIKKSGKRRVVTVDMEGVEAGGQVVEDGLYTAEIHEIEEKESSNGNPMLVVKWKITSKKSKGALIWDNVSLTPQALWRLKGMLEALGEEVPDSSLDLDLDDLIGKECRIEIANEKYEGKDRPRIGGYASLEDKGGDDEEKPSKKPNKVDDDDEDQEDDDDKDEDPDEDEKPAKRVGTGIVKGARVKFRDDKNRYVKGKVISIKGDVAKVEDEDGDEWEIELSELESAK